MEPSTKSFWHLLSRIWWVWPVATFVILVLWMGFYPQRDVFPNVLFWLIVGLLFIQFLTFVAAIVVKKWNQLIGVFIGWLASFVLFVGLLFLSAISAVAGMVANIDGEDPFGREHPIPDTLHCELPLVDYDHIYYGMNDTVGTFKKAVTPVIDSLNSLTYLQVHEGSQPGIYEYDLYALALSDGYVFLKCYEVTEDLRLSEQRITERTKVPFAGHDSFGQIVSRREFTIYEGSWDEPYAVRVEAWHHDKVLHQNRLLTSKIYKLEGWMR